MNFNKGDIGNALRDAKTDNADNVFFQIGDDQWVGSARKLKTAPMIGNVVELNGKQGIVTQVDPRYQRRDKAGNIFVGAVLGFFASGLLASVGPFTRRGGQVAIIAGAALGALIGYKLGEGRPNVDLLNSYAK